MAVNWGVWQNQIQILSGGRSIIQPQVTFINYFSSSITAHIKKNQEHKEAQRHSGKSRRIIFNNKRPAKTLNIKVI